MSATNALPGEKLDLTEANIKDAKPGDALWDAKITGLHLRCLATKKTFYLYFRTKAGVQRRPKLGDHGSITLAQARKVAGEMLGEVAAGRDPSAARAEARAEKTLEGLWLEYWKRHGSKKKSSAEDLRLWEKFFRAPAPKPGEDPKPQAPFNTLALAKLSHISYTQMANLHESITDSSGPIQANRVLAMLSTMFNFGIRPLEWTEANPTDGVKRNKEAKRKRYMAADEARRIAKVLHEKAQDVRNADSLAFLYLLILTGARKGEIAKARWDQLHGNKLILTEHKTDQDGHVRVIHLPQAAMDLLAQLPRTTGTLTGVKDPKKLWAAVRTEAECRDLRMHDLRHSFASAAISAGYTLAQIGELLGHGSEQTTKRYSHLVDEAAAASVKAIGGGIAERMGLPSAKPQQELGFSGTTQDQAGELPAPTPDPFS